MSYYAFIYGISIILSIVCGILIFRRYRNLSGFFFLLFTLFGSTWFLLYFLFFSGIENVSLLLFLSRLNFGVSLGANYSLLLFVFFFDTKPSKILTKVTYIAISIYVPILLLHALTPMIIADLAFSLQDNVYREVPGMLYLLNPILHFTGLLLFVYVSVYRLKRQAYLNKIRLQRILWGAILPLSVAIFLQLILPAFGIWILEKEIILFYLFFTVYSFHILKRYYFSVGYGFGKGFIIMISGLSAIITINAIKWLYINIRGEVISGYWILQDQYSIVDTIVGITIFYITYTLLYRAFL